MIEVKGKYNEAKIFTDVRSEERRVGKECM